MRLLKAGLLTLAPIAEGGTAGCQRGAEQAFAGRQGCRRYRHGGKHWQGGETAALAGQKESGQGLSVATCNTYPRRHRASLGRLSGC